MVVPRAAIWRRLYMTAAAIAGAPPVAAWWIWSVSDHGLEVPAA